MSLSRVIPALGLLLLGIFLVGMTGCDSTSAVTVAVQMTNADTFDPVTISINAGDTVRWTNNDIDNHAPKVDPLNVDPGGPNSDLLYPAGVIPNQSYSWTSPVNAPSGTKWYYHCRFHGIPGNGSSLGTNMVGVIIVR